MVSRKMMTMACLAVMFMAVSVQVSEAITCNQVVSYLSPCISYVAYGGVVPGNCCTGIRSLYGMARTTPDRRAVCSCLKNAINGVSISPANVQLARGLPAKCGVSVPYKIDPSTNCNTVN